MTSIINIHAHRPYVPPILEIVEIEEDALMKPNSITGQDDGTGKDPSDSGTQTDDTDKPTDPFSTSKLYEPFELDF